MDICKFVQIRGHTVREYQRMRRKFNYESLLHEEGGERRWGGGNVWRDFAYRWRQIKCQRGEWTYWIWAELVASIIDWTEIKRADDKFRLIRRISCLWIRDWNSNRIEFLIKKKNNEACLDNIEYDLNIAYNKRGGGRRGMDRLKRDNTRKIIRRRIHCDWQIRFLIKIILSYFIWSVEYRDHFRSIFLQ